MSNFLKKGKRQEKVKKDKEVKKHTKEFYKILGKINTEVIPNLDDKIEYTEENINEYVNPILGRDLDSMEKFIVLGKMFQKREVIKNNINIKSKDE